MATYLQHNITLSLPSYTGSALERELNFCNGYLKAYVSEEILNCHCLSLNAKLKLE